MPDYLGHCGGVDSLLDDAVGHQCVAECVRVDSVVLPEILVYSPPGRDVEPLQILPVRGQGGEDLDKPGLPAPAFVLDSDVDPLLPCFEPLRVCSDGFPDPRPVGELDDRYCQAGGSPRPEVAGEALEEVL